MSHGSGSLVVVGAGCAGVEAALQARASGWNGPIQVAGDENHLPYHRPPLSKGFLEAADESSINVHLKTSAVYAKGDIQHVRGVKVAAIDRRRQRLDCSDGRIMDYDKLVLATGASPRRLILPSDAPAIPENVHYLRSYDDAVRLRRSFGPERRLVIIGGGFTGLEVAASAARAGMRVVVLEASARLLARSASPLLSTYLRDLHEANDVQVRVSQRITDFRWNASGKRVVGVVSNDEAIPADCVLVSIGVEPRTELARACGLEVDNGISVDDRMRTSDKNIFAAGDCVGYYSRLYERRLRLEAVSSALEQARRVGVAVAGGELRPEAMPWFWSVQHSVQLKMLGLSQGSDRVCVRGDVESDSFSSFYFRGDRLIAVDTVNRPGDFMLCRRWLTVPRRLDSAKLADEDIPLQAALGVS